MRSGGSSAPRGRRDLRRKVFCGRIHFVVTAVDWGPDCSPSRSANKNEDARLIAVFAESIGAVFAIQIDRVKLLLPVAHFAFAPYFSGVHAVSPALFSTRRSAWLALSFSFLFWHSLGSFEAEQTCCWQQAVDYLSCWSESGAACARPGAFA